MRGFGWSEEHAGAVPVHDVRQQHSQRLWPVQTEGLSGRPQAEGTVCHYGRPCTVQKTALNSHLGRPRRR